MKPMTSAGKRVRASHDWLWFYSDWVRKWHENFQPIAKRSNAKQSEITFDAFENCLKLHVIHRFRLRYFYVI